MKAIPELTKVEVISKKGLHLDYIREVSAELAKELQPFDRDGDDTIDAGELMEIVREHKRREQRLKDRARRMVLLASGVCVVSMIAIAVLFGVVYGANQASKDSRIGAPNATRGSANAKANVMINKSTGEPVKTQATSPVMPLNPTSASVGTMSRHALRFLQQHHGLDPSRFHTLQAEGTQVDCPLDLLTVTYDPSLWTPVCTVTVSSSEISSDEYDAIASEAQANPDQIIVALTDASTGFITYVRWQLLGIVGGSAAGGGRLKSLQDMTEDSGDGFELFFNSVNDHIFDPLAKKKASSIVSPLKKSSATTTSTASVKTTTTALKLKKK